MRELCSLTFLRLTRPSPRVRINDDDPKLEVTFTIGVRKIGRVPVAAATNAVVDDDVVVILGIVVVVVVVVSRPDLTLYATRGRIIRECIISHVPWLS